MPVSDSIPTELTDILHRAKMNRESDAELLGVADALERIGQADRAELFRLEVELEKPTRPGRWREAFARRLELVGKLARWNGKLNDRVFGYLFAPVRGFQHIGCYDSDLIGEGDTGRGNLANAPAWPWMAKLSVTHSSEKSGDRVLAELLECPVLDHVTDLDLRLKSLSPVGASTFAASPKLARLRGLDLTGTKLSPAALRAILASPHLTNLREFGVSATADDREVLASATRLAGVERLSIHPEALSARGWTALGNSPHLARVRTLVIGSPTFDAAGMRSLADTALLGTVESLHLTAADNMDSVAVALAEASNARSIRDLSFRVEGMAPPKPLTSAGLTALAGSPHLSAVRSLDLYLNAVDAAGVKVLAKSEFLARLERLVLTHNPLGAASAKALAASPHLGNLTDLRLGFCKLGATSSAALLASPRLGKLEVLNLTENGVEDPAVRSLLAGAAFASLRVLGLGFNKLTDAGVESLVGTGHLAELGVLDLSGQGVKFSNFSRHGTVLTEAAIQAVTNSESLRALAVLGLGRNKAAFPARAVLERAFGTRVESTRDLFVMHLFR
jgi:hypothetical protein